jgi:hypothetical protein
MNLGHFCDPERNHIEGKQLVINAFTMRYEYYEHKHPVHSACKGMEVVDFAKPTENYLPCECHCHKSCYLK